MVRVIKTCRRALYKGTGYLTAVPKPVIRQFFTYFSLLAPLQGKPEDCELQWQVYDDQTILVKFVQT